MRNKVCINVSSNLQTAFIMTVCPRVGRLSLQMRFEREEHFEMLLGA